MEITLTDNKLKTKCNNIRIQLIRCRDNCTGWRRPDWMAKCVSGDYARQASRFEWWIAFDLWICIRIAAPFHPPHCLVNQRASNDSAISRWCIPKPEIPQAIAINKTTVDVFRKTNKQTLEFLRLMRNSRDNTRRFHSIIFFLSSFEIIRNANDQYRINMIKIQRCDIHRKQFLVACLRWNVRFHSIIEAGLAWPPPIASSQSRGSRSNRHNIQLDELT